MHRRHTKKNIPIELLRALVTIVDTGSYTKAAEALDLTQSAISSQIARLGRLLGGSIFAKGQGNMTPTKRGLLVLQYARRMLSMNDELLTFAGPNSAPRQFVIGLPSWLGRERLIEIFEHCSASEQVSFRCDRVERLLGDLNVGSIDVAYLCNTINSPRSVIAQWSEPTVWMKSPKLALRPGAPIPLISWPGTDRRSGRGGIARGPRHAFLCCVFRSGVLGAACRRRGGSRRADDAGTLHHPRHRNRP